YELDRGWGIWNLIVSLGAIFQALAILCFVYNLVRSYSKGKIAGHDPWDAWTLEWSTTSPPPVYNFSRIPVVHSRRPLWDVKHPEDPDSKYE
ncbi:MAG TPA: cytochrome ubiquinol oxidase subunit I, partial [Bryobacteraceae bacterium]